MYHIATFQSKIADVFTKHINETKQHEQRQNTIGKMVTLNDRLKSNYKKTSNKELNVKRFSQTKAI